MKRIVLGIAAWALCSPSWGMEAELTLQQLNHKGWTVSDGAPGAIYAIAQTTDGTLWVAGPSGLSRFDGIRFVRYGAAVGGEAQATDITALTASPDGSLWMGFGLGGVSVLRSGGPLHYGEQDGLPPGSVNNVMVDRSGVMYAATTRGLYQLQGNRWHRVTVEANDPTSRVSAAKIDRQGTFWVVTNDGLWARRVGEASFGQVAPRKNTRRIGPNSLASAADGKMWVLNLERIGAIVRVEAPTAQAGGGTLPELYFPDTTTNPGLTFDRDGNLWVGGDAVYRIPASALTGDLSTANPRVESFTLADGLTGRSVNCFFEDHEGNLWVGTYSGLDRFSHSNIVRVDATNTFGAAVAGNDGTVWVSAVESEPGARYPLLEVRNGAIVKKYRAPHFTSAYRSPDGSTWFGGRRGIVRYEAERPGEYNHLPVSDAVQAMVQDKSGAMWVSISRKGLYRFVNGNWISQDDNRQLPRGPPLVAASDSEGRLLFGYRHNRIARVNDAAVDRFGPADGLNVGNVTAIASRGHDIWIGGDRGVAHFDGTRFTSVLTASGVAFTGISGIVAPESGDLWLNGSVGIVHLTRAELERAIRDASYRVNAETFDRLDGLRGYARQVRPSPSAFEGTDGRIWFATQVGLAGINPSHIERNTLAPPVTIWTVAGTSVRYPARELAHLPIHTTTVRIEYTAASLTIPERVRFRYKLIGLDTDWQDAGDRREATYTNLGPGRYSFQVIAANNDGVWNNTGASFPFTIAPAYYQSKWFYGLCALVGLALLWLLYVVRIRQVSAQVRGRLEERLAERERIARELHDTLLQSVQGLVLRFRAAVVRLPPQEPTRSLLEQALERADGVLIEGRDRVKDLRSSPGGDLELPQAIAAFGEELAAEQTAQFTSTVEGAPRDLHPIVREEAMFIAREALTNAFRHATARKIEAEISYGDAELQIRIRDDGRGIDVEVLRAGGREGHWGLLGMRERAKKIRASLTIWSKPGAGTEVDVRLPADIAYQNRVSRRKSLVSRLS